MRDVRSAPSLFSPLPAILNVVFLSIQCSFTSRFLADRFVEGTCPHCGATDARGDQCDVCARTLDAVELIDPRCLINKSHKIVTRASEHMYISLDKLQPRTEQWIRQSFKEGNWSSNAVINGEGVLVDARLKGGLRPSPVTRDLSWGVPVPVAAEDEDQSMKGKVLCASQFYQLAPGSLIF